MELLICSPSARVGSTKPVGGDAVQLQLGRITASRPVKSEFYCPRNLSRLRWQQGSRSSAPRGKWHLRRS